jgi:tRNA A-37 threonylcarbamoyl transferase component Bud32
MPPVAPRQAPLNVNWRDRYQLIGRIGSGGTSVVYEARDRVANRNVAMKIMPNARGMNTRMLRDVEAAASLAHPNVVALYDWFGDGEHTYLVCELVEGESLDRLSRHLSDPFVVAAGAQLFEALAAAHAQGIIHRDIKPQNIMLDADGTLKVMDFGIALLSDGEAAARDGDLAGAVAYMSPEQAAGRRVGPPSDVYSAGMVLYELFARQHPLRGETPAQTLASVGAAQLPSLGDLRPDLPGELVALVDEACAARSADRPTAAELAAALRELLESGTLRARRLQRAQELVRPLTRVSTIVERGVGAVLSGAAAITLLHALPAYPAIWTLPIAAVTAVIWAVVPRAGLAWLLGVLAFPLFDVSAGIGAVYLVLAVLAFLLARSRPVMVVWPVLGLLLMPVYLTLAAPVAAVVFGRVRGPVTAGWAAAGVYVYLVLTGQPGPFTLFRTVPGARLALAGADDAAAVLGSVLALLLTPAGVLQIVTWAAIAGILGLALSLRSIEQRLWAWAFCFAGVFLVYTIVPGVIWGMPLDLWALVANVGAVAAVVLFPLSLWSGAWPEELTNEHLQGD